MMKRLIFLLLGLACLILPLEAQEAFLDYRWEFADLALRYPSHWDEPVQRFSTDGESVSLLLAQDLVEEESRPPAIPFITISLLRNLGTDAELYTELDNALDEININSVGALPSILFDEATIASQGYSDDGLLYGMGRIRYLDAERGVLLITGRSAASQRDSFVALFNSVANSLRLSANQTTVNPQYGVLWHTDRSFADGENAFLDIVGLSLAADGTLYAADALVGIIAIDSLSGIVKSITPYPDDIEPSAIAAANNHLYLADIVCNCIRIFENGAEIDTVGSFGIDAPRSIAVMPDMRIFGSDIIDGEVGLRAFGTEADIYFFPEISAVEPPLLTVDRLGRLVALVDNSHVYVLDETGLSLKMELAETIFATAITIDSQNQLLVATDGAGILVFNDLGEVINRIGRIVEAEPQAGEIARPQGLAVGLDGTIYWAEGDGNFGNISAVSLGVEQGRVGASNLRSGVEVQGFLSEGIQEQFWTFDGLRGDIITLTALASENADNLDLTLRLLEPSGREISLIDNDETGVLANLLDVQLNAFSLPRDGQYFVVIGRNTGEGAYRLGLSQSQVLSLTEAGGEVVGILSDTIPMQRWLIEGRSGQNLSITMQSTDGRLDPVLRLLRTSGDILAENDDSETLGYDSQILDFPINSGGFYLIEASRFNGEGNYTLRIEWADN